MPIIRANEVDDTDLRGAAQGASISLILDDSEPGHGPRLDRIHASPTFSTEWLE